MEYRDYYDGLLPLAYNDTWLIICIELAHYCESHGVRDMRYNQLKSISNAALNEITNGDRVDFGGSFNSFINSSKGNKFLRTNKVGKKETYIEPNIALIQEEIKNKKLDYLAKHDRTLFRYIGPNDTVHRHRPLPAESVTISDGVSPNDTVHRHRPLAESGTISDGVNIVVTRSNRT
jgi:hypothetical protein